MEIDKAIPEGFKMTELGFFPKEWIVTSLGEVADIQQGKTPKREDYDNDSGFRILKI